MVASFLNPVFFLKGKQMFLNDFISIQKWTIPTLFLLKKISTDFEDHKVIIHDSFESLKKLLWCIETNISN